jgi:uncharacterized protein (TIGR00725 family)
MTAESVGALLAESGAVVLTGGMGGVMEAASRGARGRDGLTVGLLPGSSRSEANKHVAVAIPTGMGEMRNALLVRSCDAIVSVGGSWGTLSEVALATRTGVPVVAIDGWDLPADDGLHVAEDAGEAVAYLLDVLGAERDGG